jgi:hypothetical protein
MSRQEWDFLFVQPRCSGNPPPSPHCGLIAAPMASQSFVQGGPAGYVKPGADQTGVRDSKKAVARPIPKRLGSSAFMPLHARTQKLHDVAERKLVKVDNFLLNLGHVDRGGMPAGAAATFTPSVADIEHAVFLLAAFRASKITRHYEIARVNAHTRERCDSHSIPKKQKTPLLPPDPTRAPRRPAGANSRPHASR